MWLNAVQMALGSFRANKTRSLLTMLGIIIGTGAVIALMALGAGFRDKVQGQIASLGSNILIVFPDASHGRNPQLNALPSLEIGDAEAIRAELKGVAAVAPQIWTTLPVKAEEKTNYPTVMGTTPDFQFIRNATLAEGRFFNPTEEAGSDSVVVLGSGVKEDLFGPDRSALGQVVRISGKPFRVIGVMSPRGAGGMTRYDDQAIVPLSAFRHRLKNQKFLTMIDVAVERSEEMDRVSAEIERVLARRHRITDDSQKNFAVFSQGDILAVTESILKTIQLFLAVTALISLLVGGVGIMNIMLVSVTERTRDIGLMKAVGATRGHIRLQFLIEAVTLCLLGGLIGIALGSGASYAVSRIAEWNIRFAPSAFALAFGFAAAVGIFFGLYPAEKAARLNPIDALRRE